MIRCQGDIIFTTPRQYWMYWWCECGQRADAGIAKVMVAEELEEFYRDFPMPTCSDQPEEKSDG